VEPITEETLHGIDLHRFQALIQQLGPCSPRPPRSRPREQPEGSSALPNVAEGRQRRRGPRARVPRRGGVGAEVGAALDVAVAWGYLDARTRAAHEVLLDRVRAMLWRLTH
jgi:hypothetical protein